MIITILLLATKYSDSRFKLRLPGEGVEPLLHYIASVTNDVSTPTEIKCSHDPRNSMEIGKWNTNFKTIEDYSQV